MALYDEVIKDLIEKKALREKGLYNGIPYPFERWRDFIPSIDPGMYYQYLGSTGVAKSRIIRYLHIYETLKFSIQNNYPVKIIYFALEDAKKSVYKKMICHYLWENHKIDIPLKILESKEEPLPDKYLQMIRKEREFYERLEQSLWIVNDATTPSEIFNVCTKMHKAYGHSHHMIAIIDNFSNIVAEPKHRSDWEAVRELSRNYIRLQLCKEMNYTVIGVLQADFESEKNTFRNSGKGSISSIEPNMGSIGDAKVVARDAFMVFALFSPWRYEIKAYPHSEGYNIDVLRNRFRSLLMLKNNEGEMAPRLGMLFDGKHEIFQEMPLLTDKEGLDRIYNQIIKEEQERKEKFTKKLLF